jgi:hypothetical protein
MFRSPLVPFVGAFGAALPSAVSLISLAIAPNSLNREQASWRTTFVDPDGSIRMMRDGSWVKEEGK